MLANPPELDGDPRRYRRGGDGERELRQYRSVCRTDNRSRALRIFVEARLAFQRSSETGIDGDINRGPATEKPDAQLVKALDTLAPTTGSDLPRHRGEPE